MAKIGHIRIDDRLIHGQIVASWISALGTSTILVADDKAATDPLQKMMLEMAVPPNIRFKLMPVDQAATLLCDPATDGSKLLVIVRNVKSALALAEAGVPMETVNVGNVSADPKKTKYFKSVWLDEKDIADFAALRDKGIYLEVRVVPGERGVELFSLINK